MTTPDDSLFNLGVSLSVCAAPLAVKDAAMERMLASMKRSREHRLMMEPQERTKDEIEDEMLRNFDATEASAINGGRE